MTGCLFLKAVFSFLFEKSGISHIHQLKIYPHVNKLMHIRFLLMIFSVYFCCLNDFIIIKLTLQFEKISELRVCVYVNPVKPRSLVTLGHWFLLSNPSSPNGHTEEK